MQGMLKLKDATIHVTLTDGALTIALDGTMGLPTNVTEKIILAVFELGLTACNCSCILADVTGGSGAQHIDKLPTPCAETKTGDTLHTENPREITPDTLITKSKSLGFLSPSVRKHGGENFKGVINASCGAEPKRCRINSTVSLGIFDLTCSSILRTYG